MINTIPASNFVSVIPGVEGLAGTALNMSGLCLTSSPRVPINTVVPFASAPAVAAYFGAASTQAIGAGYYFAGFDNSSIKPGSLAFSQYNVTPVAAWARGSLLSVSLATLQAYTGNISFVADGYTWSATGVSLTTATSFSNAASLIQTAITGTPPTGASVTGAIASTTNAFTGSIAGNTLTVTAVSSGSIVPGTIITGTGVTASTLITSQLSGTANGVGVYTVSIAQTVASTSITGSYGTLTVSAVSSGTIALQNTLTGTGVTAGTQIWAFGTGTGTTGTYFVSPSQTATSTTITVKPAVPTVAWDSTASAFTITSGAVGAVSTIAAPTGTLSALLLLTTATGVTLSQGAAAPATPAAYMTNLISETVNFATFFTDFDPDFGSGNANKQALALWNSQQNGEFCYIALDSDPNPANSATATSSLGYLLKAANTSGTICLWQTANPYLQWVVSGFGASTNYNEFNGRITFAYKGQAGLVPDVTNVTTMNNLVANGYNCYIAAATAAQQFNYLWPGSVTGPFLWADAFIGQIWMNSQFQLSLMALLTNVKSIPYNAAGYALIDAACQTVIAAGLNFGLIRQGVPLSQLQAAEVNNQAGIKIDTTLSTLGYYLQILPATAQVRQARGTPPITFWYTDGGSVQSVNLASIEIP